MATDRRVHFICVLILLYFLNLGYCQRDDEGQREQIQRDFKNKQVNGFQQQQALPKLRPFGRQNAQPLPQAQNPPNMIGGQGQAPQMVPGNPPAQVVPQAGQGQGGPALLRNIPMAGAAANAAKLAGDTIAQKNQQPLANRPIKISDTPECAEDVKAMCSANSLTNNFAVMDCLQNDIKSDRVISERCQHFVWNYKKNLTQDLRFDSAADEVCGKTLALMPDCQKLPHGKGQIIQCLIEQKKNITDSACRQFLTKIASLVFSDYRLMGNFINECSVDIDRQGCGRLGSGPEADIPHQQGATIECLSKHVKEVSIQCKHQILRVAELQADDYHLDRPLFYACREDRERFCARIQAGGGRIFKCLFRNKFEREMSAQCLEKLTQRQKLMQENYKVNRALAEACRRNIDEYNCLVESDNKEIRHVRMSRVLLCLEGQKNEGHPIEPECFNEMQAMRKNLLEDFMISPDIVSQCSEEISSVCRGMHRGGKTLHCLMDLARPRPKQEFRVHDGVNIEMKQDISPRCERALAELMREADVGEDISLDPALWEDCQSVAESACKKVSDGDANLLSCLMDKVGTKAMTRECEERLIEIQYFISRDFRLETRLYKFCRKDARDLCEAPQNWFEPGDDDETDNSDVHKPLVFSCLYSKYKRSNELSRACAFEVKRVMRQRAVDVGLEPRIEQACIVDLGSLCSEETEHGEEMECLQHNYNKLSPDCQMAVGNFTEDEAEFISMDKILMKACTPMIHRFCKDKVDKEDTEAEDIMECLISRKNHEEFDSKCRAGVEHHQLIALEDYRFNFKFKEACKEDVLTLCKGVRRKSDVVKCLSENVRDHTLQDQEHEVSRACRNQLRVEILKRGENVNLDEDLKENCEKDIFEFCSNVSPGKAAVTECLRSHMNDISRACGRLLFKRVKQQFQDSGTDYLLMSVCKPMIKAYCMEVGPSEMLPCLETNKNKANFDSSCAKLLTERQRVQKEDYRLDPRLLRRCDLDINKYCKDVRDKQDDEKANTMEGKVITCLRIRFAQRKLSHNCNLHVAEIIKESALDYKQDPVLAAKCQTEIKQHCLPDWVSDSEDDKGHVIECLKEKLATRDIANMACQKEIARVLAEDRADVHVDPLLHRACALDIKHYCFDVPSGEGRQMSCLLAALDDNSVRLKPECSKMLSERVRMWEYAARAAPPETLAEMMSQITMSTQRNYFLGVIFAMIGSIFVVGIFCGRVTKRRRPDKNK